MAAKAGISVDATPGSPNLGLTRPRVTMEADSLGQLPGRTQPHLSPAAEERE